MHSFAASCGGIPTLVCVVVPPYNSNGNLPCVPVLLLCTITDFRYLTRGTKLKAQSRFSTLTSLVVLSVTVGVGKKAIMRAKGRSNCTELDLAANAEHLTIMPVVSADGVP